MIITTQPAGRDGMWPGKLPLMRHTRHTSLSCLGKFLRENGENGNNAKENIKRYDPKLPSERMGVHPKASLGNFPVSWSGVRTTSPQTDKQEIRTMWACPFKCYTKHRANQAIAAIVD